MYIAPCKDKSKDKQLIFIAFALSGRTPRRHRYPGRCPGLGARWPFGPHRLRTLLHRGLILRCRACIFAPRGATGRHKVAPTPVRDVCSQMFYFHTDFTELTETHGLRVLAMRDVCAMICAKGCRGRTLCRPAVNLRTIAPICAGTLYNLRTIAPTRIYIKHKFIFTISAPWVGDRLNIALIVFEGAFIIGVANKILRKAVYLQNLCIFAFIICVATGALRFSLPQAGCCNNGLPNDERRCGRRTR